MLDPYSISLQCRSGVILVSCLVHWNSLMCVCEHHQQTYSCITHLTPLHCLTALTSHFTDLLHCLTSLTSHFTCSCRRVRVRTAALPLTGESPRRPWAPCTRTRTTRRPVAAVIQLSSQCSHPVHVSQSVSQSVSQLVEFIKLILHSSYTVL